MNKRYLICMSLKMLTATNPHLMQLKFNRCYASLDPLQNISEVNNGSGHLGTSSFLCLSTSEKMMKGFLMIALSWTGPGPRVRGLSKMKQNEPR
jgi:hypothetical protein